MTIKNIFTYFLLLAASITICGKAQAQQSTAELEAAIHSLSSGLGENGTSHKTHHIHKVESAANMQVFNPHITIPKDAKGIRIAGDFCPATEGFNHHLLITAADESDNPFARQFLISNMSSGFPPGELPDPWRHMIIHIPKNHPLIIDGRAGLPGGYLCHQE